MKLNKVEPIEEWKDIKITINDIEYDYTGYYQVSNCGRVKSLKRVVVKSNGALYPVEEKIIKPEKNRNGYLKVSLCKNNKVKHVSVHKLVGLMFIPNPENKPEINHKFGDKTQNIVDLDNLYGETTTIEWATRSENCKHAYDTGLKKHYKRKVNMIDIKTNQILKTYNSIKEAGGYFKKDPTQIVACCRGKRKSAFGYMWRYAENENLKPSEEVEQARMELEEEYKEYARS